jgi:hypothetical protein
MEKWNQDKGSIGLPSSFQYSNIPSPHFLSTLRQRHDDIGVPGAIEV